MNIEHLYHGTSVSNSHSILSSSLRPRIDIGNWSIAPSIPNMVYLTSNLFNAEWYGLKAALTKNEKQYSILKVWYIDADNLYPDENYFIENGNKYISAEEMLEAQNKVLIEKDKWKNSLETRQLVCHNGEISSNNIQIEIVKPISENIHYFLAAEENTVKEFNLKLTLFISINKPFYSDKKELYSFKTSEDKQTITYNSPFESYVFEKNLNGGYYGYRQ